MPSTDQRRHELHKVQATCRQLDMITAMPKKAIVSSLCSVKDDAQED
jgi:hypothetical protein